MSKIIDGYEQFFDAFSINKEDFFYFGLNNIITICKEEASLIWKKLLSDINSKSNNLYIRPFGKQGKGNKIIKELYQEILEINIKFDKTNNQNPTRLIEEFTGFKNNNNIHNYQVSHVFGCTKNVFAFTAPWNIVYIPKIIDPFTGHEASKNYAEEFKILFYNKIMNMFDKQINEYNGIMDELYPKIKNWVELNIEEKKRKHILKEFCKIQPIQ